MLRNLVMVLGLVGLIGSGFYADTRISASNDIPVGSQVQVGIQEGNQAPDFELEQVGGGQLKLSDLRGKKVILNFWASWCPPCKSEMPHMQSFYEDQKGGNVEILAVNLTNAERQKDAVDAFVKEYKLSFPILLDQNGEVGEAYRVFTIPTSLFIDSNGIIVKKMIGPMDKQMMEEMITSFE
ncbi:redoxin domain-containing protein [Bacillus sp. PS06]|uniref:redoxin domain-containing protein n=1 Tax=Bacillus sp. PS06 TaxID=2764176 RepID=UPI00177CBC44|nr:redoxin domain-containing protein [Bacillus sp. PS06]MBD8071450.1 redoxin domain-containing protein [Bacillus sp. PS06]